MRSYQPFNGIVLTDTFQMYENEGTEDKPNFPNFTDDFLENNQRVINQKQNNITVIIGNPPYSGGQKSVNDNAQNLKYEKLERKLEQTYSSKGTGKRALYDSCIKAFRWASDRIKDKGIVCFVSNGSFVDKNAMDGFRKCLVDEFTNIYCFNLRGFIRGKSGDDAKKEGQNVFNIMTGIAITLLVKNPNKKPENKVLYYDIGDYLSRSQKLNIIHYFADISAIKWEEITPNDSYDWINHRNDIFETFTSLSDKKDKASKTIFEVCCNGIVTATYEKQSELGSLFATANTEQYTKKENIPDSILKEYQQKYQDKTITKEDIFYYIYGVLHSPEYKQRFASDLKKMLPRIPFTADFWTFSKAGRELAYWHLNYETIEPYELEEFKKELYLDDEDYRVEKMGFGKNKNGTDKTIIIHNIKLTLSQIPLEAYEYIVNGKSALEWIMERYKVTKDKDSGIINNPNDWSEDPRYIVDLVKRIVRVSLETVRIVNSLPALNEIV